MYKIFLNLISVPLFSAFADIFPAPNGFRRLILDGYRFGERGSSSGENPIRYWQCTANVRDEDTGKLKRCQTRLKTTIIDGYEMIQNPNVKHNHKRADIL